MKTAITNLVTALTDLARCEECGSRSGGDCSLCALECGDCGNCEAQPEFDGLCASCFDESCYVEEAENAGEEE